MELTWVRRDLQAAAAFGVLLTLLVAGVVLALDAPRQWSDLADGVVLFPVFTVAFFMAQVWGRMPRGQVPERPPGARVRPRRRPGAGWLLYTVATAVVLLGAARLLGFDGAQLVGELAGLAAAQGAGLAVVRRWERRHDTRLLAGPGTDWLGRARLYADWI